MNKKSQTNKQTKRQKDIWYVLGISEYIPVQQLTHKNMLRKGNVVVFTDIFLSKGKLFINYSIIGIQ